MGLFLGAVYLDGFELFAPVQFGGRQALAVHKLSGGTRIIDAMGADDDTIKWQGILSGSSAAARARAIDAMRVSGTAIQVSWDVFTALVIVSDLRLEYCNTWWIPYRIACTVVKGTQTAEAQTSATDIINVVLADLGLAQYAPGVITASSALTSAGVIAQGTQAYAATASSLVDAGLAINQAISEADATMLMTADVPSLVATAGSLASLAAASGYVSRAEKNFLNAGS